MDGYFFSSWTIQPIEIGVVETRRGLCCYQGKMLGLSFRSNLAPRWSSSAACGPATSFAPIQALQPNVGLRCL